MSQQEDENKEKLSPEEHNSLVNSRLKSELASERVKTALSQKETIEAQYQNLVLTLALKHQLAEGDVIDEDGTIIRSINVKPTE